MKYKVYLYYGYNGSAVVELPRPIDPDEVGNLDELAYAMRDIGLNILSTPDEVLESFRANFNENITLYDDEFWELACKYGLWETEQGDFYEMEGLMYEPVPPNSRVGVIEPGQKMRFDHYRSGRR